MVSSQHNICGKVSVILDDGTGDLSSVRSYFAKEIAPGGAPTSARVRVHVSGRTSHHPHKVYGVTGGMDGDRFVVPDGAGHWAAIDPQQMVVSEDLHADIDACCGIFRATVLLDWLVMPICHFGLAAFGLSPFHASAAALPGQFPGPVVFSAWSGVGKTNLVLWAMAQGGHFYGDDQVVADKNGALYPSYRRIGIYGYNRTLAPNLPLIQRLKLTAGDYIHSRARASRGRVAYLLAYAANGLASTRATAVDLGGAVTTVAAAHAHVICHATSTTQSPELVALTRDQYSIRSYSSAHAAVMGYEYGWFRRFLQTWQWATPSDLDPWHALNTHWITNIQSYFESIPNLFQLKVPHGPARESSEAIWNAVLGEFSDS